MGHAGTYTGVYTGSVQACKIAVYARDTDNQTSPPQETKVYQSQGADLYEVDDTVSQANVVIINQGTGAGRRHEDGACAAAQFSLCSR